MDNRPENILPTIISSYSMPYANEDASCDEFPKVTSIYDKQEKPKRLRKSQLKSLQRRWQHIKDKETVRNCRIKRSAKLEADIRQGREMRGGACQKCRAVNRSVWTKKTSRLSHPLEISSLIITFTQPCF